MMLDSVDRRILAVLQQDCQISNQQLAERVALSASPCLRRVKLLEQFGYIRKHVALLNPEKLGLSLTIMVSVGLTGHGKKKMAAFEKRMKDLPGVVECLLVAGQAADYLLKVMVPDMAHYQDFLLNQLTESVGVSSVRSSFVLRDIISTTELPLNFMGGE